MCKPYDDVYDKMAGDLGFSLKDFNRRPMYVLRRMGTDGFAVALLAFWFKGNTDMKPLELHFFGVRIRLELFNIKR